MAEKKKYSMLVLSNPTEGQEEEYIDWYVGQHFHDLLRIPGYVGGRYYKLSDIQLGSEPHKYQYLVIWDFETEDFQAVKEDIAARMKDGRTQFIPAFDMAYWDGTFEPITKYVTSEEIKGLSVDEVHAITEVENPYRKA
ncbi:hypothetical protein [Fundicoccus culcitae]|uniref:DUF4286 family protein n=2 Tax=Fundicoccus culcitae TaxID=2969821 RepID=A0ABY5P9E0_9LACT|nr:hypothetical protein [Fundicoccus culcitae]UUX35075.1 hypothetical protein NRE15_05380 [Fundicoccus culcitae]